MNEIVFVVEEAPEGGLTARALGESIFTQAESLEELRDEACDAVHYHFGEDSNPNGIRLHYVGDKLNVRQVDSVQNFRKASGCLAAFINVSEIL